jgi:hypothetical protein
MSMQRPRYKLVWGSVERRGEKSWAMGGYAWDGKDGALYAQLSAFPMSGRICVKDGYDEAVEAALAAEEVLG